MLVVASVIRRGDEVLLVEQQGPDDSRRSWSLPGGRVEAGEFVVDAMIREVREETGLRVADPGHVAYVAQLALESTELATAIVFDVGDWEGELECRDPDRLVMACRFVPLARALELLQSLTSAVMREPAIAYLQGEAPAGAVWEYRGNVEGGDVGRCRMRAPRSRRS